jgi:hypothetical protein
MLAPMTSLALPAQAASSAAPAFNGLFYATAATLIPLLYLALFVQGPALRDLLAFARRSSRLPQKAAGLTALYLAGFMLTFTAFAEFNAVADLAWQQDSGEQFILIVTAALIAAVTVAATAGFNKLLSEEPSAEDGPAGQAPPDPGTTPAGFPPAQAGSAVASQETKGAKRSPA